MSINSRKTLFTVAQVVTIITGVIFIFGIITIPLSIFLFVASSKISEMNAMNSSEFDVAMRNRVNMGWAIFVLIVTFPIGICALLPYLMTPDEGVQRGGEAPEQVDFAKQIENLLKMKEKGTITEEEFEEAKKKILEKMTK